MSLSSHRPNRFRTIVHKPYAQPFAIAIERRLAFRFGTRPHGFVRNAARASDRIRTEPSFVEDQFPVPSRPELIALPPISDAHDFRTPCERIEVEYRHRLRLACDKIRTWFRAIMARFASGDSIPFEHVKPRSVLISDCPVNAHHAEDFRRIPHPPLAPDLCPAYHTDIETQYQYGLDVSQLPGGDAHRQIASHIGRSHRFGN